MIFDVSKLFRHAHIWNKISKIIIFSFQIESDLNFSSLGFLIRESGWNGEGFLNQIRFIVR